MNSPHYGRGLIDLTPASLALSQDSQGAHATGEKRTLTISKGYEIKWVSDIQ